MAKNKKEKFFIYIRGEIDLDLSVLGLGADLDYKELVKHDQMDFNKMLMAIVHKESGDMIVNNEDVTERFRKG